MKLSYHWMMVTNSPSPITPLLKNIWRVVKTEASRAFHWMDANNPSLWFSREQAVRKQNNLKPSRPLFLLNDGNKRSLTHQSPSFGISGNGHHKRRIFQYTRQNTKPRVLIRPMIEYITIIFECSLWAKLQKSASSFVQLRGLTKALIWQGVSSWSIDIPFSTVIIECALRVDLEKEGKDVPRNVAVHF